jgi:AraC-like DNA-binding protein
MALFAKCLAFLAPRLGSKTMSGLPPPALQVDYVSHLRLRPGWKLPEHAHPDFHEMIMVLGGEIETRIRGQVLRGPVGSVLVYPRGVPHQERAVGGPLHLLYVVWKKRSPVQAPEKWPLISRDPRGRIRELLHWLHELHPRDPATLACLLHCALVEFSRGATPSPDDPVNRACRHIDQNFAKETSLRDLAKIAGQSPYHFARLFRQRTGVPPMRYLRQVRVEAAKTLVVATPMPLRAIATQVGLVDEFHLSRVFRNVTGRPPSALRRRSQNSPLQLSANRRANTAQAGSEK